MIFLKITALWTKLDNTVSGFSPRVAVDRSIKRHEIQLSIVTLDYQTLYNQYFELKTTRIKNKISYTLYHSYLTRK